MLGAGEIGGGGLVFNGGTAKVWEDKNILEIDRGNGYITTQCMHFKATELCT